MARIDSLDVEHFEGIRAARVDLAGLTMLFGANGAGKSSVADALLYALTGETARGSVLADIVRQGEREASVCVTIGTTTIMRQRSHSGAECHVDGVRTKDADMRAAIIKATGCTPELLSVTLRSGALLTMKSVDRQRLLLALCGTAVDGQAIADTIEPRVRELMRAHSVTLPASVDRIQAVCQDVCNRRVEAHREVVSAQKQLEALGSLAGEVPEMPVAALMQRITELRGQHTEAIRTAGQAAGASEERRRQLAAEAERLRAVPEAHAPVKLSTTESGLATLDREAGRLEAECQRLRRLIEEDRATANGEQVLPEGYATIGERLREAETALAAATSRLEEQTRAGREVRAIVDAGPQAHCPRCQQGITPAHIDGLKLTLEALRQGHVELSHARDAAQERVVLLRQESSGLAAIVQRRTAQERADATQRDLLETEAKLALAKEKREGLATELERLRNEGRKAEDWQRARARLMDIEHELAKPVAAAPAVDVAPIAAEIARLEKQREVRQSYDKRAALNASLKEHSELHAALDTIAKALGPDGGLRGKLIARAVAPFVAAANAALGRLLPGYAIEAVPDDGVSLVVVRGGARLSPDRLSDGERTCVLYVLQLAVAQLARAPVVVFDRTELLDTDRRNMLGALARECCAAGIQAVLLSNRTDLMPATTPAGYAIYHLADGAARPIPAAVAA